MLTVDRAVHELRIECEGKKTPLGCMIADSVTRPTRDECNVELHRRGWRLDKGRTLCRLCEGREAAARKAKERRPK